MSSIRRLIGLTSVLFVLSACGGGGSSGDSGTQPPPPTTPTYSVTTSVAGSGSGSISPTSRTVNQGSTTSFTISPASGSTVASVSGCGGSLSGTIYTTGAISSSCAVTATFDLNAYTVTATAESGGSISPGSASVSHGSTTSFTVTPSSGFQINSVSGCGGSLSGSTYTTGPVTAACSVSATLSIAQEFGLDVRPVNYTCHVRDRPPTNASVALESVTPIYDDGVARPPLAMVQSPNDDSRWFVLSRKGIVTEYSNGPRFTKVGAFLDITDRVTLSLNGSPAEFGALGIAFHPDFEENGHVFIYYTAAGAPHVARLSRFTSSNGGATLDPSTEQILLTHELITGFHIGGNLAFGPDDYLYLGIGDGGNWLNAQDLNSLKGKMLRIDVDNGYPYAIPLDNPWAGGGGRGEIYALGLRNPWRWSFDQVSGELWLGDVGSSAWEEINLIVKGGNYGWPIREGAHCRFDAACTAGGLINPGDLIDPVTEYSHEGGSAAVIGGFVYRGSSIPNLEGTYLFMDQQDGRLWALLYDEQGNPTPEVILEAGPAYYSMAEGNDGELYLVRHDRIDRLIAQGTPPQNTFPQSLSQTGCVDPSDPTRPAVGLIPYDVNAPLWSDGAAKERWLALPDNQTIHVNEANDWEFPIGTVLIKSFLLADKLIETRLLMRHLDGGWAGYSYEWDDNQLEAHLLPAAKTKTINGQVWKYPSRSQCMQCHTQAAGITLGLETAQLNGQFIYPSTGIQANQLETLEHIGIFDAALPDSVENLPQLARIEDESQSVALRARAYLHSNCSMCHQPGGPGQGPEDFRYTTADVDMGAINVLPTQSDFQIADARLLSPGHPEKSIISFRMHTLDQGRMPPLSSTIVDLQGSNLIDSWILQMVVTGTLFDYGDTAVRP